MQKMLLLASVILTFFGMKSFAAAIDSSQNQILMDLQKSGLTISEIQNLDLLSQIDPQVFKKAIEQDFRIKGHLKIEILAAANKGGRPCVSGGVD